MLTFIVDALCGAMVGAFLVALIVAASDRGDGDE